MYPFRDLSSRPEVGISNTPCQDLPTYVEPGIEQTGQFNPNTTLRTTITVIKYYYWTECAELSNTLSNSVVATRIQTHDLPYRRPAL